MGLSIEDRRRFVRQCDPLRPLPANDPLYVPLDEGTPVRGRVSCVDALAETILVTDESCQLFTGFPGTGKTTELRRLEHRLVASKDLSTHVVYVDFEEYIDRYAPISITDVVRVIAYCMDRAALAAEGKDPDRAEGYAKRFFDYLSRTDVELNKIGFQPYGTSLMLELKNNPSFRQRAENALQGRFQQFVSDAQSVMEQAVVRLRKAKGETHADRVVVIADGLEKLTPLREEDRTQVEAAVETLFLTHRDLLRLPCHAIYTFPPWLRFRTAQLGTSYAREPLILPMVKIRQPDGSVYDAGVQKMAEMIGRRVEIPAVFGPDPKATLLPLIEASGGYPRDLLRLVRTLLMDGRQFPVQREDAERVVAELAGSYGDTVLGTYLDLLAQVGETHTLPRDDAAQLALFGRLFERWLILAYRNGEEWYDLHPLVRRAPQVQQRLAAKK